MCCVETLVFSWLLKNHEYRNYDEFCGLYIFYSIATSANHKYFYPRNSLKSPYHKRKHTRTSNFVQYISYQLLCKAQVIVIIQDQYEVKYNCHEIITQTRREELAMTRSKYLY